MKITIILLLGFQLACLSGNAQTQMQAIADKVFLVKNKSPKQQAEIDSLYAALKTYRDFETEEKALNAKVKFGFAGNESDLNNLFKIEAGIEMDTGIYPFELDLKSSFQTVIQNGAFQENISDIDISFDYHPKIGNGLFLENFVFLSRFNNTYLGIEQRYETGAGVILNFFSTKNLTQTGVENHKALNELPDYKLEGGNFWECYEDNCSMIIDAGNLSEAEKITDEEKAYIDEVRYNYTKANKKKFAKWRLALLVGVFYENEKARAENELLFNNADSLFSIPFAGTNKLRWQLRPTLVYKPDEVFTFRFYPYIKFPLTRWLDEVHFSETVFDKRPDMFYDIQASIEAKITKNISCGLRYRYMHDVAPKRKYELDLDDKPVLIVGQGSHSLYRIYFQFGF